MSGEFKLERSTASVSRTAHSVETRVKTKREATDIAKREGWVWIDGKRHWAVVVPPRQQEVQQ